MAKRAPTVFGYSLQHPDFMPLMRIRAKNTRKRYKKERRCGVSPFVTPEEPGCIVVTK